MKMYVWGTGGYDIWTRTEKLALTEPDRHMHTDTDRQKDVQS